MVQGENVPRIVADQRLAIVGLRSLPSITRQECPLLGVKRTSLTLAQMSASDPKRTLAAAKCNLDKVPDAEQDVSSRTAICLALNRIDAGAPGVSLDGCVHLMTVQVAL